jgi:hypothetical protein
MSRIDDALHRAESQGAVLRSTIDDDSDRSDAAALFESPGAQAAAGEPPTELQAMFAVGETLRALPDPDARARVLRWALQAFGGASTAEAVAVAGAPARASAAHDDLELGDLDGLFDQNAVVRPAVAAEAPESPQPRPVRAQSVESMIRGFVAEFQAFAREWGSADV